MIKVSAFRWVPPFAQGLVREFRVRWALEEAGLGYEERLIGFGDQKSPGYRELQPFGQVPAYEEDGLVLFESGAIVLHIAERSAALLPAEAAARERARTWMFAALNTIEPPIQNLAEIDLFHGSEEWTRQRRPQVVAAVRHRLTGLAEFLGGREYLEGRFTAADLLMTTVLRILRHTELLDEVPRLKDYRQRCEARPAFSRAMADHLAPFAVNGPPTT